MDGGDGHDIIRAERAGESIRNGEDVSIALDVDQPQTDDWSCGPNSASRVLRAYGYDASYAEVSSTVPYWLALMDANRQH